MKPFGLLLHLIVLCAAPLALRAFDPNANGNVYAVAVQSDGRVLLGGGFTTVQPADAPAPVARHRLARFHADGRLDETFQPALDGDVSALLVQPDGRIVVAGDFATVRPAGPAGTARVRFGLLRLEADGTLDETFDPRPLGGSPSLAPVSALALDADGNLLIGGGFTSLQPHGSGTAVARARLARLTPAGAVDPAFSPAFDNLVFALAVQPDGRIVVGGGFTAVQGTGAAAATEAVRLVRLEADGTVDATFAARADNRVLSLVLEADGAIVAGGDFLNVRGADDDADVARAHLARWTAAGRLDTSYDPSADGSVGTLALQRDGKLLVGGEFSSFHSIYAGTGTSRTYFARLLRDGTVDTGFAPIVSSTVRAIALQADGGIVVGGVFTRVTPAGAYASLLRNRAARFLSTGDLDGALAGADGGSVFVSAVETGGSVLVAGLFREIAGETRPFLARILADGTLAPDFHPAFNGSVNALTVQADGLILVGGNFTEIDGVERTYLARLNADGSLDADFNPGPSNTVYAFHMQSGGNILVGGSFTTWNLDDGAGDDDDGDGETDDDTTRAYLAELTAEGKLTSLDWSPNGAVTAIVPQADGKLILAGDFSTIGGAARSYVARLSASGTVDENFNPAPNYTVAAIAVQPDGKVLLGGSFVVVQLDDGEADDDDGDDATDDDADRVRLVRLNADGSLDRTFNPGTDAQVNSLAVLGDGRILVGGHFATLGTTDTARRFLAALHADGSVDTAFNVQPNDRVNHLATGADGSVYASGRFTSATSGTGETLAAPARVIRLTSAGALDPAWRVHADNAASARVQAIAAQPDGRVLVGGSFARLGGTDTVNLARFTGEGLPDTSFAVDTDGAVRALLVQPMTNAATARVNTLAWFESAGTVRAGFDRADLANVSGRINAVLVQPDGSLLVGGSFTIVGSAIRHLARFSAAGVLDRSYDLALDGSVAALGRQSDGRIVLGGAFTSVAGATRTYLARLNADGTPDTGYAPPALNGTVAALAIQSDDAAVLGGSFTSVEIDDGSGDDDDGDGTTTDDTGRKYLARFKADGTLDTTYDPTANGPVTTLLRLPDGSMLAGGSFSTFTPNGSSSSTSRSYLALLNTDGTVNTALHVDPNGAVSALARQADGKILVGGTFSIVQLDDGEADDDDGDDATDDDADRQNLFRLNADYSLDRTFKSSPNSTVYALAVHPDGRILVGGAFNGFDLDDDTTLARNAIAVLGATGAVDTAFNLGADGLVYTIAVADDASFLIAGAFTDLLTDSPLYVGGEFQTIAGLALPRLARLNENGTPDGGFAPAPDAAVHALAVDTAGRVLVAGAFANIAGTPRSRLARFTRLGELDTGFAPAVDGAIHALALAGDGSILLGGDFATVAGAAHTRVARLDAQGAPDAAFTATVDGRVLALAALPGGRVLLAGEFATVNGTARPYLARLNADGTLDAAFAPAPDAAVRSLAVRLDGSVLAGGDFTQIGGQARARLALLQADGAADAAFAAGADGAVHVVAARLDGRALVGGAFAQLAGSAEYLFGGIGGATPAAQAFAVAADRQSATWTLTGASPAFSAVSLAYSTNGNSWTTLDGVSVSADGRVWAWSGTTALPGDVNYLLRARAVLPVSGGGSSGVVESAWQFFNTRAAGTIVAGSGDSGSGNGGGTGGEGGSGGTGGDGSSSGVTPSAHFSGVTNASAAGYLADFTTLLRLPAGDVQFVNFVLAGSSSRRFFIRAAGPGLQRMGVSDFAATPRFELYTAAGALWVAGAGPVTDTATVALAEQLGALALVSTEADAAVVTLLPPGAYTLAVWDAAGIGGAVMVELYEADATVPARLVAFSSRAHAAANTGTQALEFTITGTAARGVLVRALGPALQSQGLSGANANPSLLVQDAAGATVMTNDDWETPVSTGSQTAATATQLATAATAVGATALTSGSRDAALYVSLTPGTYTATVAGPSGATGITELEVFELPAVTGNVTTPGTDTATPANSGGGGAPSLWFMAVLTFLLLGRARPFRM